MPRRRVTHEERQIRDAFIDGWLSGLPDNAETRRSAMEAWRTENTTNHADDVGWLPEEPTP